MVGKRALAFLGLLVAVSMVLGACSVPSGDPVVETVVVVETVEVERTVEVVREVTPEPEPTGPKTLVVCQGAEPRTLYPYGETSLAATHILHAVYDGPIDNRTYAYQPIILEKLPALEDGDAVVSTVIVQTGDLVVTDDYEVMELAEGMPVRPAGCRSAECAVAFDGAPLEMEQMVATFRLKPNVRWSDGRPLTADDSLYGFELNLDPDTPTSRFLVDRTATYEVLDELTTRWTGLPGYIDETYFLNFWHPFPRHLWQETLGYTAEDLLQADESARLPMGWGAFVIKEWVPGDHITLERNPHYFRSDEGLPYIDRIVFRFVPDPNAVAAQLISGECHIATQDTYLDEKAELLLRLEQEAILTPLFVPSTVWEHVDFGIAPVAEYDRPDFFGDVRMRHAVAYCLNRQRVVDEVLYGRSRVIHSYVPPDHPLYAGEVLIQYPYDPDQGMALLEEMGWVLNEADGVRQAQGVDGIADGTRLAFKWQSNTLPLRVAYMERFEQDLAACGFEVALEHLPTAEFYAEGPAGLLFGRRFDLSSFAWFSRVEPRCDLYLSANIPSAANGWAGDNNTGFSNEEYDAACQRALSALPGSADYIQGHREAQRVFSEQLPVIPLFLHLKMTAARPEVRGFILDPTEASEMWNVEAFDLAER